MLWSQVLSQPQVPGPLRGLVPQPLGPMSLASLWSHVLFWEGEGGGGEDKAPVLVLTEGLGGRGSQSGLRTEVPSLPPSPFTPPLPLLSHLWMARTRYRGMPLPLPLVWTKTAILPPPNRTQHRQDIIGQDASCIFRQDHFLDDKI